MKQHLWHTETLSGAAASHLLFLNGQECQEECQGLVFSDSELKQVVEIIPLLNLFMTITPLSSTETTSSVSVILPLEKMIVVL